MIVVVGSLNMDLVVRVPRAPRPGETLLGSGYETHPGGKGANQAVAAARFGAPVRMVGRVGRDAYGDPLAHRLAAEGIDLGFLEQTDDKTGVAFITVDEAGQNSIIVAPGANAALRPEDLTERVFEGAEVVLVQLEIPLKTALRAAALGRAAGARVLLNLAPAQALSAAQLGDVDLLLVNEHEAATLLGAPEVLGDLGAALAGLRRFVPAVVLTLGGRGAAWAGPEGSGLEPAHRVRVVDTTAAGDAFAGALAAELARGATLEAAVRYAGAAGALAVSRSGAQPSLPTREEAERLLRGAG
ncbi:ribokinase [Truepera radiovictrix]|uniref:Ribokinase n=1 Tax=Truepera radiovictrix (strain DSM 17093 / CIP 108686 / LMG 22925 / RQ-24) TaxID=649638 RepID=D7CTI5_TRURR|nr:ribokinase [Truepera radiovictrix]ADI13842.1 ribokinase [Truepera radiovictrix DSM 17093]WMT57593.1 ribokinase [Truepera radiovictrix]